MMPNISCANNPTARSETARLRNNFFRVAGNDEAFNKALIAITFPSVATRENASRPFLKERRPQITIRSSRNPNEEQTNASQKRNFKRIAITYYTARCSLLSSVNYHEDCSCCCVLFCWLCLRRPVKGSARSAGRGNQFGEFWKGANQLW
ncbi:hypothetical protein ACROYT_G001039 [Oculina patagonica]